MVLSKLNNRMRINFVGENKECVLINGESEVVLRYKYGNIHRYTERERHREREREREKGKEQAHGKVGKGGVTEINFRPMSVVTAMKRG